MVGLLALLPQFLSTNGNRYAEHKAYFADTLLTQVGSLTLVSGDGVVFLPAERIAWKLRDKQSPRNPGLGETPFFAAMLRPHLRTGRADPVWNALAEEFFRAEAKVVRFTEARRKFDSEFNGRLDRMIRERIGEGYRAVWWNERSGDISVSESRFAAPTYHAYNFLTACCLWYLDMFEIRPGYQWELYRPTAFPENRAGGRSWRLGVGGGDGRDYLWGGPVPADMAVIETAATGILDDLRFDVGLKRLFLSADIAEREARAALERLPLPADHAADLLRHGPDVPGRCQYCVQWWPRL